MLVSSRIAKNATLLIRSFASFKKYDYTDALNYKSLLNEEEVMVMENAAKFAQTHLAPRVIEDNKR